MNYTLELPAKTAVQYLRAWATREANMLSRSSLRKVASRHGWHDLAFWVINHTEQDLETILLDTRAVGVLTEGVGKEPLPDFGERAMRRKPHGHPALSDEDDQRETIRRYFLHAKPTPDMAGQTSKPSPGLDLDEKYVTPSGGAAAEIEDYRWLQDAGEWVYKLTGRFAYYREEDLEQVS